jgi:hypothetical protein
MYHKLYDSCSLGLKPFHHRMFRSNYAVAEKDLLCMILELLEKLCPDGRSFTAATALRRGAIRGRRRRSCPFRPPLSGKS